jgi:histidinol phosphatase-like PHP family hydrolase
LSRFAERDVRRSRHRAKLLSCAAIDPPGWHAARWLIGGVDINGTVSAALRDFATIQRSIQSRWGYKRAAAAVRRLERPLPDLLDAGVLPRIHGIGPASTRIILEVLEHGFSPTVEQAIVDSGQQQEIARRRALRTGFLSRAEVVRLLCLDVPDIVSVDDYRGDCQMHSVWSDGVETIEQLAQGAIARGWDRIAITDHAKGLPIAGGMSIEAMRRQHAEIDDLNQRLGGRLRVLKGVEANILADGSLDLRGDDLAGVEMLLAAPHSKLRVLDDQTDRLLAAVRTPGVHVLAHPRGRMSDSRPGIAADWDRVFEEAAALGVAIEIDGDPARQDLDYQLADRAREAGCLFALDSDAHDSEAFIYADTAIAHARLAGIPAARVINCWELPRLLAWLEERRPFGSA